MQIVFDHEQVLIRIGKRSVAFLDWRMCAPKDVLIQTIYVLPEYRGRGYAKKLVQALVEKLENGTVIELFPQPFGDTKITRDQLITMYESMGFKKSRSPYLSMEVNHE